MPEGLRELAVAIATGSAADVVLHGRFRWSDEEIGPETVSRSVAEIIRNASMSMVAQANLTQDSVLGILKQD